MNNIGIETLSLRVERACSNALGLAKYLSKLGEVTVNYPGLESSGYHNLAKQMFGDKFGAILTVRVGSKQKAFDFINHLKIPKIVSNIGDTKTLVIHPASTIALHSSDEQKGAAGVYEDLIRISVGIEDINDLTADFKSAWDEINKE